MHTNANIMYGGLDPELSKNVKELKAVAVTNREELIKLVNRFKELNKKLLK